jgi:hypothetical protein
LCEKLRHAVDDPILGADKVGGYTSHPYIRALRMVPWEYRSRNGSPKDRAKLAVHAVSFGERVQVPASLVINSCFSRLFREAMS